MISKLLTIVVPVYKVEQYICKCLDSCVILNEDGTLDDKKMSQLEVIIVNDGTPDRSAEMARNYTVRYPETFRQIDKENGGHGSAWNVGLKEAKGKYLRFLDSDDWLVNLQTFLHHIENVDTDIIFTDYKKVDESTGRETYFKLNCDRGQVLPITSINFCNQMTGYAILIFHQSTYKTSILQSQWPLFEEHVMYDDCILLIAPLLYGRTFLYLDFTLYNYLTGRKGQSMSKEVISKNVISLVKCYERLLIWKRKPEVRNIPLEHRMSIDRSVEIYARQVFRLLPNLPYGVAKARMNLLYPDAYPDSEVNRSKFARRYEILPFPLFFLVERVRLFMGKNTASF